MKKPFLLITILSMSFLTGCSTSYDNNLVNLEVGNALSFHQSEQVIYSAIANINQVKSSSFKIEIENDDEAFYGEASGSSSESKSTHTMNYTVYSDYAFKSSFVYSNEGENRGVKVKSGGIINAYQKALHASTSTGDNYYGLYLKSETKSDGHDYYGTDYYLSEPSFASDENIKAKFNEQVSANLFPSINSSSSFYKSGNDVKAVYTNYYFSSKNNVLYPNDSTKAISVLNESSDVYDFTYKEGQGYYLTSYETIDKTTPLTDFEGNINHDYVSYSKETGQLEYGDRELSGFDFTINDYENQVNYAPILTLASRDYSANPFVVQSSYLSFEDYSSDYQQINGSGHAYTLTTKLNDDNTLSAYCFNTKKRMDGGDTTPLWSLNDITLEDGLVLTKYDNTYFNISNQGKYGVKIDVLLNDDYSLKTITIRNKQKQY